MPTIYTVNGKEFDTEKLPDSIEGLYCGSCGCRIGWFDSGHSDAAGIQYCDDCVADLTKSDEEED